MTNKHDAWIEVAQRAIGELGTKPISKVLMDEVLAELGVRGKVAAVALEQRLVARINALPVPRDFATLRHAIHEEFEAYGNEMLTSYVEAIADLAKSTH